MIRTYKRKLILSKAQEKRICSWIGTCRLLYNIGLEIKNKTYEVTGKSIHRFELQKQLTTIKDIEWVKDVPSQSLQCVIQRLEISFQNFFRTHKLGGGYPKFASKKNYQSIVFPVATVNKNTVTLPKIGVVKMFKDSEIIGIFKTATIKKEPTGFFINITCENVPSKFYSENQTIGLDMGISQFCVDSNGEFIANPRHFKKYERRLRIENRSLSRKKKRSNSWKHQVLKLARLHHKIANVRKDFLHKESTKIAKANMFVFLEDLNVSGMTKNKNLSKHILDCGWGLFRTMLEYKTQVIAVNAAYTSQTCSQCGEVDRESRKNQSTYYCTNCGHKDNADFNAAKNIRGKGIAINRQREALACA